MTFGETIREARLAKGLSIAETARRATIGDGNLAKLEKGQQSTTYEIAELICAVLEISYPLNEFKHRARWKRGIQSWRLQMNNKKENKRKDTTIEDEAEGRKLGISGSMYRMYVDTGYIQTFKAQVEALRERDKGANIIESHIGAGITGSRRPQSVDGAKLS